MCDDVRASLRHWLQKTCPHLVETTSLSLSTIWKHQQSNQREFSCPSRDAADVLKVTSQYESRQIGQLIVPGVGLKKSTCSPVKGTTLFQPFYELDCLSRQLLWLNMQQYQYPAVCNRKEKILGNVLLWMMSLFTILSKFKVSWL